MITLEDERQLLPTRLLNVLAFAFVNFAADVLNETMNPQIFHQLFKDVRADVERSRKFAEEVLDHWNHLMTGDMDVFDADAVVSELRKVKWDQFYRFANHTLNRMPSPQLILIQLDAAANLDPFKIKPESEFTVQADYLHLPFYAPFYSFSNVNDYKFQAGLPFGR